MMDHSLQTISYIADISDIVVLMARRKHKGQDGDAASSSQSQKKCLMICHVFSSDDVSLFKCLKLVSVLNSGVQHFCHNKLLYNFSSKV